MKPMLEHGGMLERKEICSKVEKNSNHASRLISLDFLGHQFCQSASMARSVIARSKVFSVINHHWICLSDKVL